MAAMIDRMVRAARLDAGLYEEVERDQSATTQALTVVVLASVAGGIGAVGRAGLLGLALGAVGNIIGWLLWAAIILLIGTKILPTPDTKADLGELLRTLGFASAPGVIRLLGIVPGFGAIIGIVAAFWTLAAMVIAVRQALDYTSTGRAIAVCLIGFLGYMAVGMLLLGGILRPS